jgi:N-methylhydantoinase B
MKHATPVEIEIIRNAFNAAATEMGVALYRAAHSPIIYEGKDCSVGLYDDQARLLGQAPGLPIFLGGLETCIQIVTNRIGVAGYLDGDVYLMNDSYLQGSHLTDITVFAPIFFERELVAFAATRADGGHLGGKDLGVSSDTTHIYQEGMRIPPVRLVKQGVLDEELLELVAINSYFHEPRKGDLSAQIAACYKGRERILELYAKYGKRVIDDAKTDIFRQSRELDAAVVTGIPDGTYTAEGHIDNDGIGSEPIPVRVAITIDGSQMTIDLTGSSGPTRGPINSGTAQAISACRLAFKELVNSDQPVTGGNFQNMRVLVPEVSIFNAKEPAPCQWYYTPLGLLIDLIQKALAPVLPDKVAAAHFGDSMIVSFFADTTAESDGFAYIAAELGGWGAFADGDGQDCMINVINGDFKALPVEFVEVMFPLTIQEWSLRADSGGAGRHRGGAGERKVFRVDRDDVYFSCWLDRTLTPAWGLFGGCEARSSRAVINEGTPDERVHHKVTNVRLQQGDTVTLYTGGGGGYGPAHERDPDNIRTDLEAGYITVAHARDVYGYAGNAVDR